MPSMAASLTVELLLYSHRGGLHLFGLCQNHHQTRTRRGRQTRRVRDLRVSWLHIYFLYPASACPV